ncbi:MAG: retropepsin-like aspartic protease [Nitrososphaeria archaeon]
MKYSFEYTPPAPSLTVKLTRPFSDHSLELKAKLDTGADITVLPQHVIDKLELIPSSLVSILSFDGKKVQRYTYFVNISFQNFEYRMVEVVGAERKDALLGRDILNRLKTVLDGKNLDFTFLDP